jgi:hypothetical protein
VLAPATLPPYSENSRNLGQWFCVPLFRVVCLCQVVDLAFRLLEESRRSSLGVAAYLGYRENLPNYFLSDLSQVGLDIPGSVVLELLLSRTLSETLATGRQPGARSTPCSRRQGSARGRRAPWCTTVPGDMTLGATVFGPSDGERG